MSNRVVPALLLDPGEVQVSCFERSYVRVLYGKERNFYIERQRIGSRQEMKTANLVAWAAFREGLSIYGVDFPSLVYRITQHTVQEIETRGKRLKPHDFDRIVAAAKPAEKCPSL